MKKRGNKKIRGIPKVVLVGRPNVGKSTLFNRFTRSRDALVDSTPGLTRDLRYRDIHWSRMRLRLVDTGGLEFTRKPDHLTDLVKKRCIKAIEEADLLLVVMDAREGFSHTDKDLIRTIRPYAKPVIIVVNKIDTPSHAFYMNEFYEAGADIITPVSAEHGRGLRTLKERVVEVLEQNGWAPEPLQVSITGEESGTEKTGGDVDAIRVAFIGRPNVGKSSLINRLVGEPRMIVTDISGTTRDAIDTLFQRPDRSDIILTDTAGIRRKARVKDKIEKFSIIKAIEVIKTCDIALVVLDVSEGITDQDKRLIGYCEDSGCGCITIYNKWDLVQGDARLTRLRTRELKMAKRFVPYSPHLNTSALTGKGVKRILPLIDRVYGEFNSSISTGKANRILENATTKRNPPLARGRYLKLFYTTQTSTKPPTFMIFSNYPESIPAHYKRFLANQFREQMNIADTPIRIIFRKRDRRN
ncbi:MAG TPA: ribosome biogenesis GTPase Der [Thermodesulfobacteriaceae bacterium]|nr:ribosome biogenesis GTPase Der [Thermodesulfobacteriaceae bacterium]